MKTGKIISQELALCGFQILGGVKVFVESGGKNGYAIPLNEVKRIAGIKDTNPERVIRVAASAFRVLAENMNIEISSPCIRPDIPLTEQPRIETIITDEGITRALLTEDLGFFWAALAADLNPHGVYHAFLQSLVIEKSFGLDVIDKPEYDVSEPLEGYGLNTVEYRSTVRDMIIAAYPNASPFAIDRGTNVWFERFRQCLAVQYSFEYQDETVKDIADALLTNVALCLTTRLKLKLPAYDLV